MPSSCRVQRTRGQFWGMANQRDVLNLTFCHVCLPQLFGHSYLLQLFGHSYLPQLFGHSYLLQLQEPGCYGLNLFSVYSDMQIGSEL